MVLSVGLFYLSLILGTILAQTVGHYLNDPDRSSICTSPRWDLES